MWCLSHFEVLQPFGKGLFTNQQKFRRKWFNVALNGVIIESQEKSAKPSLQLHLLSEFLLHLYVLQNTSQLYLVIYTLFLSAFFTRQIYSSSFTPASFFSWATIAFCFSNCPICKQMDVEAHLLVDIFPNKGRLFLHRGHNNCTLIETGAVFQILFLEGSKESHQLPCNNSLMLPSPPSFGFFYITYFERDLFRPNSLQISNKGMKKQRNAAKHNCTYLFVSENNHCNLQSEFQMSHRFNIWKGLLVFFYVDIVKPSRSSSFHQDQVGFDFVSLTDVEFK